MHLLLSCLGCLPGVETTPYSQINHLGPYEPIYFIADGGANDDGILYTKFQLSLAICLWSQERREEPGTGISWIDRKNGGFASFTQTTLWDWHDESLPIIDSTYKPELCYHWTWDRPWLDAIGHQAVEVGAFHESNGKGGADSRSLHVTPFLRPVVGWNLADSDLWLVLHPRIAPWTFGVAEENPDIFTYRGHVDLEGGIGAIDGWWINQRLRIGNDFDRGSSQTDLSVPFACCPWLRGMDGLFQVQYFNGYGETLLHYSERTWRLGIGLGIVR